MKKLVILLFFILLFISCSDDKKETEQQLNKTETPIITPQYKAQLKYIFKKGQLYKYKIQTISESNQVVEADSILTSTANQTVNYLVNLKIVEVDDFNNAVINMKISSIIVDATINGQHLKYDSKFIYSSRERVMYAEYESVKNKSFKMKVSEYGEIVEIYKFNDIVDEMLIIQNKSNINSEERDAIVSTLTDTALKPLCEQIIRVVPSEKVGINYSWSKSYFTNFAMFEIENIASYKILEFFKDDTDSLVKIGATLSINWTGQNEVTDKGVKYFFHDPIISGSSIIIFNKDKGFVQKSESSTMTRLDVDIESYDANGNLVKAKRRDFTSNKNIIELLK